ncbi:nitronate monooxygenase family protein [Novosphingobium sp. PY1]|uniref:NAD(P)H-dependent flavin oxidoreductase n=1 Tax=Novosphingobium sp. PY1 TaxID=1882221 RepID=UPI001A8C554B|nr:nitronate monooxygenase [Novosphingobium sp. PY1]GFM28875.1 2-nitropropane dioxygenase, NPD [Novosphingobium sp. PY1]
MGNPLQTVLCERLGCSAPIIQTAMGWVAEPSLVIASSNAGAFGFLGAAVMTPDEVREKILAVRKGTDRPFGVNFHSFQPGADRIVELILENREQVRAVSFGRGPNARMIGRFKDAGILCIPTVGAVKHAKKMVELGVDMVSVQGGEGGGHTGSVPTTILLPQVLDSVDVPVIACGGFADGRGLVAALAYGAVGIAMGTRFLLTQESPVPDVTKAEYLKASTDAIVVTTKLDGIPQRMIRSKLMDRIEESGSLGMWLRAMEAGLQMKKQTGASWLEFIRSAKGMTAHGAMPLKQAMMAATMPMLIQKAVVEGDVEHGVMATGVVGGRIAEIPTCEQLVGRIMEQARGRLEALGVPAPQPASAA